MGLNKYGNLSEKIEDNISVFQKLFINDLSVKFREININGNASIKCEIIYIDPMIDKQILDEHILRPIMSNNLRKIVSPQNILNVLIKDVITAGEVKKLKSIDDILSELIYGSVVLLVDRGNEALIISSIGWKIRAIEEPPSESLIRGPREGFTESIIMNLSFLRRRINTPDLKFNFIELGEKTKTKIAISYIEGVALQPIIDEVFRRINRIKIDGILDSNYVEELISDEPYFFLKTVGDSQRPDVIASKLLEGRIAILCDGSPEVLTVPFIFTEVFQSAEDYYNNFVYMTFNRILRGIAFFLTTSVPAIYVALVNFHQELIPTPLLLSMVAARQGVPFPTVVEALSMTFIYEILREAGARSPKQIGQAVSIVGALVLGDAAVNARFISAPIVIITATAGITGLAIPKVLSLVIIRIIFILLAAFQGLYGYIFGVLGFTIYLMSVRSFGVMYMEGVGPGPISGQYLKDTAVRAPWWAMNTRPHSFSGNRIRNISRKPKSE